LQDEIEDVIEIKVKRSIDMDELEQMKFGPMQAPAASHMIGPDMHRLISEKVAKVISDIV
jgi:hypothetical protein